MEPGLAHFPGGYSRCITKSLWNPWEESTGYCVYSIPRPAHASIVFITLGKFQKHPCFKQKTRQFDCPLGCVISLRRKTQNTDSYINIPHMPLHQDSKVHLDTNPPNHQRPSVEWLNTDGDWQTQPEAPLLPCVALYMISKELTDYNKSS